MKAQLEQIRRAAKEALASFDSAEQLEKARIQYLGKKGELTAILKQMGKLSAEERPVIGQLANEIRKDIEDTIANKSAEIKKAAQEKRLAEGNPGCDHARHLAADWLQTPAVHRPGRNQGHLYGHGL